MIKAIKNRRSIRNYRQDDVSEKIILELIKAAQFAPNSHNNKSWQFVVVKDLNIKKNLYKIINSPFIKSAPVLIIPLIDTEKSFRPIQDLSVASENILLQAVDSGLGGVWKNIKEEKEPIIKKLLDIPDNYKLINIIPIGYPSVIKRPHRDSDFKINRIHFEKW